MSDKPLFLTRFKVAIALVMAVVASGALINSYLSGSREMANDHAKLKADAKLLFDRLASQHPSSKGFSINGSSPGDIYEVAIIGGNYSISGGTPKLCLFLHRYAAETGAQPSMTMGEAKERCSDPASFAIKISSFQSEDPGPERSGGS